MTSERALEIAREFTSEPHSLDFFAAVVEAAEKLAIAAVAEERERCAKIADIFGQQAQSTKEQLGEDCQEIRFSIGVAASAAKTIASQIRGEK